MHHLRRILSYSALSLFLVITGCTSQNDLSAEIYDPAEPLNRTIHGFNKGVDKYAFRPVSQAYGAITPDPVENLVENLGDNLSSPADAINHLLQGDIAASITAVGRFGVNSTIGLVGLFDPATTLGLAEKQTNFGETLGKWGVGEGAYVELPFLGPSTVRDTTGRIVDVFIDPVNSFIKSPESDYVLGAKALDIIDGRHRYGPVIDQVLYESVDSYTAARLGYLQSQRTIEKGQTDEEDLEDPFAFE